MTPIFLRGDTVHLTPLAAGEEELLAARPGLGRGEDRIVLAARRATNGALVGLATLEAIDWPWREAVLAWVDHDAGQDEATEAGRMLFQYALQELALERLHVEEPLATWTGIGPRFAREIPLTL